MDDAASARSRTGSVGPVGLVLTGNAARVGVEPFFMELIAGMEENLVRSGVRVPAQLSLLGWGDSALCELAVPPLSVVSIDVHEHGVTLGRAMLDVLAGGPRRDHAGPPIRILHRGSTAPAAEWSTP